MNDNPYSTPTADLIDSEITSDSFYVVSIKKFSILFLSTFGLYTLYWFYQNWALYRAKTGEKMWPVMRAIFSIFFTHSLYRKVQENLEDRKIEFSWMPSTSATLYVLFVVTLEIVDRLANKQIGLPFTALASVPLTLVIWYVMLIPQKAINACCGDPEGNQNSTLTAANIGWIAFGLLIWGLILLGLIASLGFIDALPI